MRITRTAVAVGLLAVEAGLAGLGVVVHHGLTAEYGDVTHSAFEEMRSGFSAGIGGVALALVTVVAVVAASVSSQRRILLTAVAIPVLMVVAMLAVTPAALRHKLEVQYDAVPRCVSEEDLGPGPGTRAARESQRAFESIEHVGLFGGGGASGVGGCDRPFVLTEDVDVLAHYRRALPQAGWRVVEEDTDRLRAEREGMAFELVMCAHGGVVWAGEVGDDGARCHGH